MTQSTNSSMAPVSSGLSSGGGQSANLGDILERVLDRGLVIAGDIKVNLLDIELLTVKLRLLVVSVETARELGIDWWEHDPWLTEGSRGRRDLEDENRELRERVRALEAGSGDGDHPIIQGESTSTDRSDKQPSRSEESADDG